MGSLNGPHCLSCGQKLALPQKSQKQPFSYTTNHISKVDKDHGWRSGLFIIAITFTITLTIALTPTFQTTRQIPAPSPFFSDRSTRSLRTYSPPARLYLDVAKDVLPWLRWNRSPLANSGTTPTLASSLTSPTTKTDTTKRWSWEAYWSTRGRKYSVQGMPTPWRASTISGRITWPKSSGTRRNSYSAHLWKDSKWCLHYPMREEPGRRVAELGSPRRRG